MSREKHLVRLGSLQKKYLTAGEPEKPCFVTRGVKEAIWQVRLLAPFSSARLAPSLHFSPPDGRSTRYERQDFVALACRAQRTVQVLLRAPSGSRLFPPPGSRLVLTALSRYFASPRGEKCRLARSKSHAGGVTRLWTDCVLPSRFRRAAPGSVRSRAEVARNPLGDGHLQSSALSFVRGDHPDRSILLTPHRG